MAFRLKNTGKNYAEFDLTSKHGTNANYSKSALPGDSPNKGFLKTLLNPVGALVKKFAPKNKLLNAVADPIGSIRGKNPAFAAQTTQTTQTGDQTANVDPNAATQEDPNAIAAVPQPETDQNVVA